MSSDQLYAEALGLETDYLAAGPLCTSACGVLENARDNGAETPELVLAARSARSDYELASIAFLAKCRAAGKMLAKEKKIAAAAQSAIECAAMDTEIRPAGDGPGHYWHEANGSTFLCFADAPPPAVTPNNVALRGYVAHAAKLGASKDEYAAALVATLGRTVKNSDGLWTHERNTSLLDALKARQ